MISCTLNLVQNLLRNAAACTDSPPAGRSRHHLDDLYRLGKIGHMRGIDAKLRGLEAMRAGV